jgi:peptidoglycan/LPS O-acetylase OafA/YrhL
VNRAVMQRLREYVAVATLILILVLLVMGAVATPKGPATPLDEAATAVVGVLILLAVVQSLDVICSTLDRKERGPGG